MVRRARPAKLLRKSASKKAPAKKTAESTKREIPDNQPSFPFCSPMDSILKPPAARLAKILEENQSKGEIRIPGKRTTKLASAPVPTLAGEIAHDFKVIPKEKKPPRSDSEMSSLYGTSTYSPQINGKATTIKLVLTPLGVSAEESLIKDPTKEDFAKSLESAVRARSSVGTDYSHPIPVQVTDAVTASISGVAQIQQSPEEVKELSDLNEVGSKWAAYSPTPTSDMVDELLRADNKEKADAHAILKVAEEISNKEYEERAARHRALHDCIKSVHDNFLSVWDKNGFIKADLVRDISNDLLKRIASSESFQAMTAKLYEEASRYPRGMVDLSTCVQVSVSVTEQNLITDTTDILVGVDFRNLIMP